MHPSKSVFDQMRASLPLALAVILGCASVMVLALMSKSFDVIVLAFILPSIFLVSVIVLQWIKRNAVLRVYDRYSIEIINEHAMISVVDLQGNLLNANENFCKTTGYSLNELVNGKIFDLCYFEEDQPEFLKILRTLRKGDRWSGEVRLRTRDGAEIWTHSTSMPTRSIFGKVTGAIMVRTDITTVKCAKNLNGLIRAFDNLLDQVAVFSGRDGRIEYLNKSALKLFNMTPNQVTQKYMADIELVYDTEYVESQITKLAKEKLDFVDFSLSLEGTSFDVRVQSVETSPGMRNLIAFFRDQTDKNALEREKSQFISTVSHELRTPLTSIKGALGLALSTGLENAPERVHGLLKMAQRNAERLILIVNDILDLEKMDAGQMAFDLQNVSLSEIIDDAVQANQPYFDELGVLVEFDEPETEILANLDRDRIAQVLSNLLSNAAKFSKTGEIMTVKIWETEDEVGFSISDRGVGIPASEIETIFERFRQAKNSKQAAKSGTGLGLAIVQTIMQGHNGTVSLESQEGQGTTVHCKFPRSSANRAEEGSSVAA